MQCFKLKDFCFYDPTSINNEFECHGKLSFNCGGMLCSKNQYSCQVLSLFSMLDGIRLVEPNVVKKFKQKYPDGNIMPNVNN